MTNDIEERFWAKVQPSPALDCWVWTAATDLAGYGRFNLGKKRGTVLAHRFAYELLRGEIPPGLVIDHLCRTPACVNPWHLEPVTNRVNVGRGLSGKRYADRTHCPRKHAYTAENTYVIPNSGSRSCRECKKAEARDRWARQKASA